MYDRKWLRWVVTFSAVKDSCQKIIADTHNSCKALDTCKLSQVHVIVASQVFLPDMVSVIPVMFKSCIIPTCLPGLFTRVGLLNLELLWRILACSHIRYLKGHLEWEEWWKITGGITGWW